MPTAGMSFGAGGWFHGSASAAVVGLAGGSDSERPASSNLEAASLRPVIIPLG